MPLNVPLTDLLAYTDWERHQWQAWFAGPGKDAHTTSVGPHGDGRLKTVLDVVRHIVSAEKRYVDRLMRRPLTDPAAIPTELDAVFEFGRQGRKELEALTATFPDDQWDVPADHDIVNRKFRLTPRKIVLHTLLHETRHWAQIATLLRMAGHKIAPHDFLLSPILGDPWAPGRA
jgi:uncharacterized damage-inducible protein DinB